MLTNAELAAYRQTLLALRRDQLERADELTRATNQELHSETDRILPDRPENQGDSRNEEIEQEIDLALLEHAKLTAQDVDAALQRIDDGTFGICQSCGHSIAKERLRTLPATLYCIKCARKVQAQP